MTSILTYLKSDKQFTLYCRDKKIMRKAKKSFVHKHKGHK